MATWNPDEDESARRLGCGCALGVAILVGLGGGTWWLANASPWAEEVQSRWDASPMARQVDALEAAWADSPPGRFVDRLLSLGAGGDRLARYAPADTHVYAEISPSWWARFGLSQWRPQPGGEQDASLDELRRWTRTQWGLEWDEDVAPWLQPDVGVLVRESADAAGAATPEWSLWLGSRDDGRARQAIAKARAYRDAAGDAVGEAIHGRTRYEILTSKAGERYTLALFGGYVVMAASPAAIERLIDQVEQGGPSLASSNPRYRRMARAWDRGAVGHAFVDLAARQAPPTPAAEAPLPPVEALGASLSGGADWCAISLTTAFDVAGEPPEARRRWREVAPPLDARTFDRLPSASVLAFGGTATPRTREWLAAPLAALWGPLGGGETQGLAFAGLVSALQTVEGPFAFGLVAAPAEGGAGDPVGAVLALRPEDPAATRGELERAAKALVGRTDPARLPGAAGQWASHPWVKAVVPAVAELKTEQHGRDTWQVLRTGGQPLVGWTAEGAELVLAGGGEALRLSQGDDFRPLTRAANYEDVRRRLPDDLAVLAYADGPNALNLLDASPLLPAKHAAQAKRVLKPLRAIGAAAAPGVDRRGFHHAGLTVLVNP